jgi:hypothetical protein
VCGLKLVESQLLASLAAANTRSDAATLRAQRLAAALEAAAAKLTATAAHPHQHEQHQAALDGRGLPDAATGLAAQVAQLQCQLLMRSQEAYALQDQLLQAKQAAAAHELTVAELRAQLCDRSQASAAQQAADAAALAAQRSALMAATASEEARLRREIQVGSWVDACLSTHATQIMDRQCRGLLTPHTPPRRPAVACCHQELRQLLQEQSCESSAALGALRAAAAQEAEETAASAAEAAQSAAAAALHAAEVRAVLLEGQLEVTELERDELQQQVRLWSGVACLCPASQQRVSGWPRSPSRSGSLHPLGSARGCR